MRITGFNIKNFKGIKDAGIGFSDFDTARVHTLVGLNESGETTLLEAMHSFSQMKPNLSLKVRELSDSNGNSGYQETKYQTSAEILVSCSYSGHRQRLGPVL